jgi:hypothetical protein
MIIKIEKTNGEMVGVELTDICMVSFEGKDNKFDIIFKNAGRAGIIGPDLRLNVKEWIKKEVEEQTKKAY